MVRFVLAALILTACNGEPDDTEVFDLAPLSDLVDGDAVMIHLEELDRIASENGGHRSWASPGYAASVDYVTGVLEDAGYTVVEDTHIYGNDYLVSVDFAQTAPTSETYFYAGPFADPANNFGLFEGTGNGAVTAAVTSVDLILPPPSTDNTSTSGCDTADFTNFPSGNIALIQRGGCNFSIKAGNAVAAGASAIVIFNEGQSGRTDIVSGFIQNGTSIPAIAIGFALGDALATAELTGNLELSIDVESESRVGLTNVITETDGPEDSVILIGAHLDSVRNGPGINDNASGSALVLELAVQLAELDPLLAHKVRFAWWDAEELGLVGAELYWEAIGNQGRSQTRVYFNYDMVGSPNGTRMVYDGDDPLAFGDPDPDALAGDIEQATMDWFESEGLAAEQMAVPLGAGFDSMVFSADEVPSPGLFSGAFETKTTEQAAAFGGEADSPMDSCYHEACDTIDNIDPVLLDEMGRAAAHVIEKVITEPL